MKVFTILYITITASVLVAGEAKEAEDYDASTVKSVTDSPPTYSSIKYSNPPYVPSKAAAYSPPQQVNYVVQPSYKFLPQQAPSQAQVSYVPGQQPQYEVGQQNVVYSQPQFSKSIPALQKIAYSSAPSPSPASVPAPIQYSSAGDVSSFKFSSPLVSYSNLGVLSQVSGKSASQVAGHQQPQAQQVAYTPSPQQFVYRPRFQASPIHAVSQPSPVPQPAPKFIYTQVPQVAYANVPQQQPVYPASTQKLPASIPQHLVYSRPQQFTYTPVQQASYNTQPAQPVQPAHSFPQPVFIIAPQHPTQGVTYAQQ